MENAKLGNCLCHDHISKQEIILHSVGRSFGSGAYYWWLHRILKPSWSDESDASDVSDLSGCEPRHDTGLLGTIGLQ